MVFVSLLAPAFRSKRSEIVLKTIKELLLNFIRKKTQRNTLIYQILKKYNILC